MITPKNSQAALLRNSPLYSLSDLVKGIEEDIQLSSNRVDTTRGLTLEQRHKHI